MMKYYILCFLMVLISCKINSYEQLPNHQKKKTGRWIEKDDYPQQTFLSIGRYKKGEKKGVWKTYRNGKLYQKDVIKDSVTTTILYQENGKRQAKGQTKRISKPGSVHWFYFGDWIYYDEKGNPSYIKTYNKDKSTDSIGYKKRIHKSLNPFKKSS